MAVPSRALDIVTDKRLAIELQKSTYAGCPLFLNKDLFIRLILKAQFLIYVTCIINYSVIIVMHKLYNLRHKNCILTLFI